MADEKIKFVIEVDDDGTPIVKKFAKGADKQFEKVEKSIKKNLSTAIKRFADKAKGAFTSVSRSIFSLKGAIAGLALGAVVKSISNMVSGWEELSKVQEQAEATLAAAMQSMGRFSKESYNNILKTASAIQGLTTYGDEAIISGTKFLMTYKNISDDVMPRAMKVMTDLAALMGGDTKNAANMLGKASMGLSGELRRVGITIDETIAKSGDFAAILGEIEKQVGGQAEALAQTSAGGIQQFANLIGDIKEKLGLFTSAVKLHIVDKAMPIFKQLYENISAIPKERLDEWAETTGDAIVKMFKGGVDWGNDMLTLVDKVYEAFKSLQTMLAKALEGFNSFAAKSREFQSTLGGLRSSGGAVRGPLQGGEPKYYKSSESLQSILDLERSSAQWGAVAGENVKEYDEGQKKIAGIQNAYNQLFDPKITTPGSPASTPGTPASTPGRQSYGPNVQIATFVDSETSVDSPAAQETAAKQMAAFARIVARGAGDVDWQPPAKSTYYEDDEW